LERTHEMWEWSNEPPVVAPVLWKGHPQPPPQHLKSDSLVQRQGAVLRQEQENSNSPNRHSPVPGRAMGSTTALSAIESTTTLTWQKTPETFILARSRVRASDTKVPVLQDRLDLMFDTRNRLPANSEGTHYFTLGKATQYMPFCNDHG
jgi:hypothetical protein